MKRNFIFFIILELLFTGCVKQDLAREKGSIVILMYHKLVEGQPANSYERTAKDFEADLKYIAEKNINVITFNDLEKVTASGQMPEGNSVIITFDDGNSSWYSLVRPLILKYKMRATFFLWVNMIDHDQFLTWNQVELMSNYSYGESKRPFIFESHTYSHQFLFQRKSQFTTESEYNTYLDYELGESKRLIDKHSPDEVSALALPYGDGANDPDIISAAKRNGYRFIRTSQWKAIENPDLNLYSIPSFPMLDTTKSERIGYFPNL